MFIQCCFLMKLIFMWMDLHGMDSVKEQGVKKVTVWCGIYRDRLIGPFMFHDTVNGNNISMLKHQMMPALHNDHPVWFQQDGAPTYYATLVRNWLDKEFPNQWTLDWTSGHSGLAAKVSWPSALGFIYGDTSRHLCIQKKLLT